MRTPYCGAIGLQRREVDQLRTSIGVEVGRLVEVEQRNALIDESVRRERSVASAALDVPATAYFLRMRAERARLEADRQVIDARVTQLRGQAREAFGSLTVIEGAAERYRHEEMRQIEAAHQAVIDDRSATDFAQKVRLARVAGRRRS
jgi:hypothetical protein